MARAGKPKIKLAKKDFQKLLLMQQQATARTAQAVAQNVRAKVPPDVEVGVMDTINEEGRPASLVTIMHPAGLALQARLGALTMSAAQLGLDTNRYPIN